MNFKGSLAVISGASRGIGKATALELARRGARVVLLARSAELLEKITLDISAAGGDAKAYAIDLADETAVVELGEKIIREIGTPDILINNAGAGRFLYLDETPEDEIQAMTALPYLAACYLTRAFLPAMRSNKKGVIVHLTSPAAFLPWAGATAYAGARWAVRGLHEALRADLFGSELHSMLVIPGKVASSYFDANANSEQRLPKIARWIRVLEPHEVAQAVICGIERRKNQVFLPLSLRLTYFLTWLCPGFVQWLTHATGYRRKAD